MAINTTAKKEQKSAGRRPRQKRSKERFEAILDAADHLLADQEPGELSIYSIAEKASMAPASVYHLFPDTDSVFLALAERLHAQFIANIDELPEYAKTSWQALTDYRFGVARDIYNKTASARKLLLGSSLSRTLIARDMEFDRNFAVLGEQDLHALFYMPEHPCLIERLTELFVINDSLWALSVERHGIITDELEEITRRARNAYVRTFLPEYLERRG